MTQKQTIGLVLGILVVAAVAFIVFFTLRKQDNYNRQPRTDWLGTGLNTVSPDLPPTRPEDEKTDAAEIWHRVFVGIALEEASVLRGGTRQEPYHAWLTFAAPPTLQGKLLAHNPYMRVPCRAVHPHAEIVGEPDHCYGAFGYKNEWTQNGKSWIAIDSKTNQVTFYEIDELNYQSFPFEIAQ